MQSLNHRHIFFLTYLIHRRRHHQKCVVNVNHIRLDVAKNLTHSHFTVIGGNDSTKKADLLYERKRINFVIGTPVCRYPMATLLQQACFLGDNYVLSTWLLIGVMDDENFHGLIAKNEE